MNTNAPAVCASKHGWPTFHDADRVAREQNKRKHGDKVRPYRCPTCQQYHLAGSAWNRRRRA